VNKLDLRNLPPSELLQMMHTLAPTAPAAMARSAPIRAQLLPYQAAALYYLAQQYDLDALRIVEIGTLFGYSTSIISQAARRARITTLNPNAGEVAIARRNLAGCHNVTCIEMASWDYYPAAPVNVEMVFVDGDHKRAVRDLPWWNVLAFGGLMLFHDYSAATCGPVVAAVNRLCEQLKKAAPDVVIIDANGIGMAGIYKDAYIGWPGVA